METIDYPDDLEIFVITNGRKTLEYVMRHLEVQTIKRKVTIIRDMKWVDALNRCVELCKSHYFLRVDDDMVLHPYTVAYYVSKIPKVTRKKGGVFYCRLWEDWSNKPVGGLRMYLRRAAAKVKFRASKLGKVDKMFPAQIEKYGWKRIKNRSIVGIHVLASEKDQIKYRNLWRDKNATVSKAKFTRTFDNKIHPVRKNISKQCHMLRKIPKLNRKYKGQFVNFIVQQQKLEHG